MLSEIYLVSIEISVFCLIALDTPPICCQIEMRHLSQSSLRFAALHLEVKTSSFIATGNVFSLSENSFSAVTASFSSLLLTNSLKEDNRFFSFSYYN
jgi:hypothetical protein